MMLRRGVPQPIRWALIGLMLAVAGTAGGRAHGQGEAATTATRSDGEQPTSTSMSGASTASASDTSDQPPVQDPRTVVLTGDSMTIADIVDIAQGRATIEVSNDGMERIRAARAVVDHFIEEGLPAYGITTMYGADFQTTLPPGSETDPCRSSTPAPCERHGPSSQTATHVASRGQAPIWSQRWWTGSTRTTCPTTSSTETPWAMPI